MCGITGAVGRLSHRSTAAPARAEVASCVDRMSAALKHRGPDGDGVWATQSGEVVFAHRRLAIIDLSEAGAQPMVDRESGCTISFNGEIYNYKELRPELESLGETFNSTSDTEVVLKAYKRWGLAVVPRLRGIFALAIWDPRSRSVHLVRDQLGVKPLYWTVVRDSALGPEVLLFASELRSLLASGVVKRRLDPAGVASYLAQGFTIGPTTIVEGVNLLPAATTLTIEPGASEHNSNARTLRTYWTPPSSVARRTTETELREELARAVTMQLVSDVPLGVFLSGGIDSSTIAALASENAPDAVHTFTIGFEEAGLDESVYAARVAEAIGSRHTNVTLREQHFIEHLPHALDAIDQPTFDGINTYYVSRAAREAGMTVALAGTGGDELFGGYPTFAELPKVFRAGAWMPRVLGSAIGGASHVVGGVFWNLLRAAPPQTRWGKLADVAQAAHDLVGIYQVSYALFTRETQARLASTHSTSGAGRSGVRAAGGNRTSVACPDRRQRNSARGLLARALRVPRGASAARHGRSEHGRVARGARTAARSCSVRDRRRHRPGTTLLSTAEKAASERRRVEPARPRVIRQAQVGLRAADRRMGPTPSAARDGARALRRGIDRPGWAATQDRGRFLALVLRGKAGPLLVQGLVALRFSRLVREARHDARLMNDQSTAPRVLIVSSYQIHPPRSGGHLRTSGLANALARRGAEVFVYSFMGRKSDYLARVPSGTQALSGGVPEYVNRSFLGFLAAYGSFWLDLPPVWLTGFLRTACTSGLTVLLPRVLREKLAWCDVLIADAPFTYPILRVATAKNRLRVLNTHNIEHHLIELRGRWRDRHVRAMVRKVELAAAGSADLVISCAEQDGQFFESNCEIRRSLLVPNGIDVERFRYSQGIRTSTRNELGFPDDSVRLFLFTASKYGPNQEAFDFLLAFAKTHERELVAHGIHLLVVGNVVEAPIRHPALTATGRVDVVEPYFAAADAAINPLTAGSGTNVKMGEFIAARLPILASSFGARGYRIEHARTGSVFERENLLPALIEFRKLFDDDPARLKSMSDEAFLENQRVINMDECVLPLMEIIRDHRAMRQHLPP